MDNKHMKTCNMQLSNFLRGLDEFYGQKRTLSKPKINEWDQMKLIGIYTAKETRNKMKRQPSE